uniref:Putative secreted protein n=1 Tax=Rhipicephalus microplus TaxID=6941 RepID=A0A6M2DBZ5_RHIMP
MCKHYYTLTYFTWWVYKLLCPCYCASRTYGHKCRTCTTAIIIGNSAVVLGHLLGYGSCAFWCSNIAGDLVEFHYCKVYQQPLFGHLSGKELSAAITSILPFHPITYLF